MVSRGRHRVALALGGFQLLLVQGRAFCRLKAGVRSQESSFTNRSEKRIAHRDKRRGHAMKNPLLSDNSGTGGTPVVHAHRFSRVVTDDVSTSPKAIHR